MYTFARTGSVMAGTNAAQAAVDLSTPLQQFVDVVDTAGNLLSEGSKRSTELVRAPCRSLSPAAPRRACPALEKAARASRASGSLIASAGSQSHGALRARRSRSKFAGK